MFCYVSILSMHTSNFLANNKKNLFFKSQNVQQSGLGSFHITGGGNWDFWFCGFGQFLVRFFGLRSEKLQFFGFSVLCGLRVFSHLAFGFRFLSTMMTVFRILLPNSFYGFSGFAKEVTPSSHAKTIILRDHLQLEECMTSLVSSAAIIWVVAAAKQPRGQMWVNFCWVCVAGLSEPLPYTPFQYKFTVVYCESVNLIGAISVDYLLIVNSYASVHIMHHV